MTRLAAVAVMLVATVECAASFAYSAELPGSFANYSRTSWGLVEGAPDGTVYALAQDRDGHLWLGTAVGLYRFDGTHFLSWSALGLDAALRGPVQALYAARDGSVWIGLGGSGGVYRVLGSTVRSFPFVDHASHKAVNTIVEDATGRLWVGSEAGLYRLDGERWHKWPISKGSPDAAVWGAHVSSAGDLFVTTARGLFVRPRDSEVFHELGYEGEAGSPLLRPAPPKEPHSGPTTARIASDEVVRSIVSDQSGRLFASDWRFGFRMLGDGSGFSSHDRGRGLQVMIDRRGALWVATLSHGVWRVSAWQTGTPVTQRITALSGLPSDGGFSLLEDRDGNIWVGGTPNGLTRLSPSRFLPLVHDSMVTALAATPNGRVWVGTADALLQVALPDAKPPVEHQHITFASIRTLHAAADGTVWVATQRGLLKVAPGKTLAVARVSDDLRDVNSITSHPRRGVFLSDRNRGLLRWDESRGFENVMLPDALGGMRVVTTFADSRARIWIVFTTGLVARLDGDDHIEIFDQPRGFAAGPYWVVHEDDQGVLWFGGTNGITRYEHDRVVTISDSERLPMRRVKAIAHDRRGFLWIAVDNGILRIRATELKKTASTASLWPAYQMYDKPDELAGLPRLLSDAMSIRTPGGSLWFVTGKGITVIDPNVTEDDIAPVVAIDRVLADDRDVDVLPHAAMPAGTRRLQVEYSAPNLSSAERTRYRVRLAGVDPDWVSAGLRRQATYMNLAPGAYSFQVQATSPLGTWQEAGSTWEFSIEPYFYQTAWFLVLCGSLIVLMACAAWTLRLQRERSRFAVLLRERARVSREIHDTLLQGVVGLALQCDALALDLEVAAPEMSGRLLTLRKQAQRYIKESRQAIWNLRFGSSDREVLIGSLRRLGDLAADRHVEFHFTVTGSPRDMGCDTEQQLVRIAREAVTNALLHSGAGRIDVELVYGRSQLVLRVSDDGHGFVDADATEMGGHFGIVGMRERSECIGASFHVASAAGKGTVIEVIAGGHNRPAISA